MSEAFHARTIRPSVATSIAVGDCDPRDDSPAARRYIRRLDRERPRRRDGRSRHLPQRRPGSASCPRAVPHRSPSCGLATSPSRESTPDYHALVTANMVLGGQFSQPDQREPAPGQGLHVRRADRLRFRRRPGPFVLQVGVQTSATARVDRGVDRRNFGDGRYRGPSTARSSAGARRRSRAVRAELRDGGSDRARGDAAGAVRSARRLFRRVRSAGSTLTTDEVTSAMARAPRTPRASRRSSSATTTWSAPISALGLGDPVVLPAETFDSREPWSAGQAGISH